MNDLLQATGYAALVYVAFNYLISFGSGRPLVEWINPGRRYIPWLAGAMLGGAYTSLLRATYKYGMNHFELLRELISEEKAKPEVVGGVSFLVFGLAIMMVAIWCWWFLPRAPQTFNANPSNLIKEYTRALRHYVRWRGGIDYAILCEVRGGKLEIVAEGSDDRDILRGLNRLPGIHTPTDARGRPDIAPQKMHWKALALDLFGKWSQLDAIIAPACQGKNVGISFDVRYGAVYGEMLESDPTPTDGLPAGVFLFAVTLNQHEVTSLTAARHFAMLTQALRFIRSGVAKT